MFDFKYGFPMLLIWSLVAWGWFNFFTVVFFG